MLKLKNLGLLAFFATGSALAQVSNAFLQQMQQDGGVQPQNQNQPTVVGGSNGGNGQIYNPSLQTPSTNPPNYVRGGNNEILPINNNPSAYRSQSASPAVTELVPPPPVYVKKPINIPDSEVQKATIDSMKQDYFGVTSDEIRSFRQEADDRAKAAATLPGVPPKPVTRTINIPLTPGTPPQIIRTFVNTSTSLIVTDSSGTPWPVLNYAIGNENAFEIKRLDIADTEKQGTSGGSMFSVIPKIPYAESNLVLALKGLPTPVVLTLLSSQKEVDYRADLRVLSRGPNTVVYQEPSVAGPNSDLLPILDGVPDEAEKLEVAGEHTEGTMAWLKNNKMLIKTDLKILSPASTSFVQSPDGTSVYEFMPTGSLLAMKDGKFINVNISGW